MKRYICIKSYPGVPIDTIHEFPDDETYIGWDHWSEYWRLMLPGEKSIQEVIDSKKTIKTL